MKKNLGIITLCCTMILLAIPPSAAQNRDSAGVVRNDSIALMADSLNTPREDTAAVIDNSHAVEIMRQSQNEDLTTSIREKILQEQIDALRENDRQRIAMQRQLDDLRINDSLRRAEQSRYIDSLRQTAVGAPVIMKADTLYRIYTSMGPITPNERARLNSERVMHAARIFSLKQDSLTVVMNNSTADIMFGTTVIASVTETDALWMELPAHELAERYKERILESITDYRKSVSTFAILKTIGLCLLVVVGFYFAIRGTTYLFRKVVDRKMTSHKDKWFKGLRIKTLEVLNSDRELKAALFVSRMMRWLFYVILFYLAILFLFGIFPMTQRLAGTLFGWVWEPFSTMLVNMVKYLPKLFRIVVIVFIIRYVIKFCRYLTNEISSGRLVVPGFYPDWAKATFSIVRIFLYAFMIILIFPYLPDSDSGVFKGVSVFMGAIFTLGSTSVIGNLMAGMVITYMRPFKLGDRIKIGEVLGDVIEKSPFVIRIKTHKNEIVTVPNSTVLSTNVINYSATSENDAGLIVNTTVGIGYEVPWRQVNQLLIDAALKTEHILEKPQPFVLQTSLDDFAAAYQLCAYTKNPSKQASIYSDLHQNIQDVFRDAGIEITTMHYRAVRNGDKSTVPAE